ncbi:hypothetical protein OKW29_004639 [Paraburkholderia sp. CI3]
MKGFRTGREDWFAGRCHVRALVSYDDVMKKTKSLYHGHRFPASVISHAVRSYPAAKTEIPELANVKHVFVKACARVNNRAENRSYDASKLSTG